MEDSINLTTFRQTTDQRRRSQVRPAAKRRGLRRRLLSMVCCNLSASMRRIWRRIANRLRIRKTGLMKLKYDVKACEYQDVHVLWDLLQKNGKDPMVKKKKPYQKVWAWAKRSPHICRDI